MINTGNQVKTLLGDPDPIIMSLHLIRHAVREVYQRPADFSEVIQLPLHPLTSHHTLSDDETLIQIRLDCVRLRGFDPLSAGLWWAYRQDGKPIYDGHSAGLGNYNEELISYIQLNPTDQPLSQSQIYTLKETARYVSIIFDAYKKSYDADLRVNSGYRSRAQAIAIKKKKAEEGYPNYPVALNGYHQKAMAVDIGAPPKKANQLCELILELILQGKIPKGGVAIDRSANYVHYDRRGKMATWEYKGYELNKKQKALYDKIG